MPIYEYKCPHCGHQFEVMHAVNAEPPKCERCGRAVRRVFSPVGIIFKGSGWHITDYRKTPAPSDGEGKKSEKPSEKGSADGGSSTGKEKSAATDGGASATSNGTSSGGSRGAGSKSASRSGGGTTA